MQRKLADILAPGSRWGSLTTIGFAKMAFSSSGDKKPVYRFLCDCGQETEIRGYHVSSGKTKSCGCLISKTLANLHVRHGAARTGKFDPAYRSWRNMLTRARNPNIKGAHRYVLRGIGVCPEWDPRLTKNAFENFLAYVGPRPSDKHVLDRLDPDHGYQPGNVRWVHSSETREILPRSRLVVYKGQRMTVAEAARQSGLKRQMITDRLRAGWKLDDVFKPRARSEFGKGPHSRPGVKPRS